MDSSVVTNKSQNYMVRSGRKIKSMNKSQADTYQNTSLFKPQTSFLKPPNDNSLKKPELRHVMSSISSFDHNSRLDPLKSFQINRKQSRSSVGTRMNTGGSQKKILLHSQQTNNYQTPLLVNQNVRDTETFDDILKTKYDEDMARYRYKSKNPEIMRKEGVQNLIFNQKLQNKLKYSQKCKNNLTALPVAKGTVSIMLNVQRKDIGFNLQSFKKNIPVKSKFKLKWKTIQWLLNNRKDQIQQIFSNYSAMLKFASNKKEGMDRVDFGELLSFVGLGADVNLADKLFYIFDEDGNGAVDYKELIIGLEVFKDSTIDEKMKVFFDLCDTDGNGDITQKEVYDVLKRNLLTSNDKTKLKKIITRIFQECDMNGDGVLDRAEVLEASKYNIPLRSLLEESIRNVKQIDRIIENDLQEPFNCYVPISSNFANYKEGIFFPEMDEVFRALQEVEDIYQKNRKFQIKSRKENLIDDSLFDDQE